MSNNARRPIARVTYKRGDTTYSVLSVWPGNYRGLYSISLDKGTDKYPAIGFLDLIKAFAAREGFVNISIESEREQRPRRDEGGYGGGDDEGIPF